MNIKIEALEKRIEELERFVKRHNARETISRMVINNMYGRYPAKDSNLYYQKLIDTATEILDRESGYTPIQITIDDLGDKENGN